MDTTCLSLIVFHVTSCVPSVSQKTKKPTLKDMNRRKLKADGQDYNASLKELNCRLDNTGRELSALCDQSTVCLSWSRRARQPSASYQLT